MTDLRERLRAADPARDARPLDEVELAAMRQAMREAAPVRSRLGKPVLGAMALAAVVLIALLVGLPDEERPAPPAAPVPSIVEVPLPPAPDVVPQPTVAVAPPQRRSPVLRPAAIPTPTQVREVRFVTANGTQILWTFRSTEEGA